MYAIEIASCDVIPSVIKIGAGVQATLKLCLRNSRGCDGITDESGL
jgi:uncharacterized protein YraI